MSTRVYDWLDGTTDDEEADPALSCERSPSASLHRALERGDAARARLILDHHGGDALDVPRLAAVLPLVARLGLVSDALRAGLTADSMSPALQDVLVRSVVQANLPQDAAALAKHGGRLFNRAGHASLHPPQGDPKRGLAGSRAPLG
jgi:hypothetical protein